MTGSFGILKFTKQTVSKMALELVEQITAQVSKMPWKKTHLCFHGHCSSRTPNMSLHPSKNSLCTKQWKLLRERAALRIPHHLLASHIPSPRQDQQAFLSVPALLFLACHSLLLQEVLHLCGSKIKCWLKALSCTGIC